MSADLLKEAWYVLHTKSRFENVVKDGLIKKSFEAFLPKIKVKSKRKDRKLMIQVPLFPGYLFVRSDLNPPEHLEILKTVGVVRFVGNKSGPLSVFEETIESLKIMVMGREEIITGFRFKKGDKIIVVSGPLVGITGQFVQYRGQGRVVVDINALGQFAAVNVDEEDVELIPGILS
jgi:transcriptional antiterminator NusG